MKYINKEESTTSALDSQFTALEWEKTEQASHLVSLQLHMEVVEDWSHHDKLGTLRPLALKTYMTFS